MGKCEHCKFWDTKDAPQRNTGFCRRYPPSAHPVSLPQEHPITRQRSRVLQNMALWPVMKGEDFCGEYAAAIKLAG